MAFVYAIYIIFDAFFIIELLVPCCSGAISKECPDGMCKNGNCTLVREKVRCSCYNAGSGELCDILTDESFCKVLQCQNGLCKFSNDNKFYCECITGWESTNCNIQKKIYHNGGKKVPRKDGVTSCPFGYFMCPSGQCSKTTVTNCDGTKDCTDGSDEACSDTGVIFKYPEETRYQWTDIEKDIKSTNTGQVRDYTGIVVMIGIIGFLSIFVFVFTKLLRGSQHDHFFVGTGLRNYLGGLHAAQLQDEENMNRNRALREAQSLRHHGNVLPGCTCTLDSGPLCNCPSNGTNHRLTLEASVRLMHICVDDSISNWSDNVDPPPVYADIVSERVSFSCRRGSETPPPAYEDLGF